MEINKLSYEDAINKLQNILTELENESCTLSESLSKFKEGMELFNYCSDILRTTEGEVKILLGENKGSLEEYNFIKEAEDEYY